ncbi:MAG: prepilin-type N-terminal cleavage/methylation domain-containing protein [Planctomycetaceae bacterium]|nr:prepilin-type N-terminal cleavage/methylation domain-containing protein [Planctomycetaceae bacterium]
MLRKLRQKSYVQAQSAHRGLTLLEVLLSIAIIAVGMQILLASLNIGLRARTASLTDQHVHEQVQTLMASLASGLQPIPTRPQHLADSNWTWTAELKPHGDDIELVQVVLTLSPVNSKARHKTSQRFVQLTRRSLLATTDSSTRFGAER